MGKVRDTERGPILYYSAIKLKTYIDNLSNIADDSLLILMVLLGEYLFARYCVNGSYGNGFYLVYPSTVKESMRGTKYAGISEYVITLRNIIAHNYGSEYMNIRLKLIRNNQNILNNFLKFLLIDYPCPESNIKPEVELNEKTESDITAGFMKACELM